MMTKPQVENRDEQHYVAIRTQVTMKEMGEGVIPRLHSEVFGWLREKGIVPSGAPFIRYLVIDMERKLDIELAVPIASPLSGDGRITPGVLPAGCYASLIYTGLIDAIPANGALLNWGAEQGLVWDQWTTEKGDAFGARIESFLTDPADEPDQEKWETQVAIRLKDE
jgi:effector-binding domain-containing protein